VAFFLYAVLAGKFFEYHWLPLRYFCCVSAALLLVPLRAIRPTRHAAATGIAFWAFLGALCLDSLVTVAWPTGTKHACGWALTFKVKGGVPDTVADFLQANMRPGDTVQPLDWTGGAVHGMLLARARLATSFIADPSFYHHVSNPYIRGLRQRFIAELSSHPPTFLIEVPRGDTRMTGEDTSYEFPELTRFIAERYSVALRSDSVTIYRRVRVR
jgi:hypothetical protein